MLVRNTYKLNNGDFSSKVVEWLGTYINVNALFEAAEQHREFGAVAVEVERYDEQNGIWVSIKKWTLPKMVAYSQRKYVVAVISDKPALLCKGGEYLHGWHEVPKMFVAKDLVGIATYKTYTSAVAAAKRAAAKWGKAKAGYIDVWYECLPEHLEVVKER